MKHRWIYAWIMVLPAMTLLVAFTHYPAIRTIINSFWSTGRGRRQSVFTGLDNYERLLTDDVFWQVLWNNLLYAAVTIPLSIAIALSMALFVNRRITGLGFLRMAYFTRRFYR